MGEDRECIFCGHYGQLTQEHLVSKWIWSSYAKTPGDQPGGHVNVTPHADGVTIAPGHLQKKGSTAKQRYIVCKACNGGWMSQLEQAAIPVLSRLQRAPLAPLSPEERHIVASWATLKSMVLEHGQPDKAIISKQQRVFLMQHRTPPDGWYVSVAKYVGKQTRPHWGCFGGFLMDEEGRPLWPDGLGDFQTTYLGWNNLVIRTSSFNTPELSSRFFVDPTSHFAAQAQRLIWPDDGMRLELLGAAVDDLDLERIASDLTNAPLGRFLAPEEMARIVGNSGLMLLKHNP